MSNDPGDRKQTVLFIKYLNNFFCDIWLLGIQKYLISNYHFAFSLWTFSIQLQTGTFSYYNLIIVTRVPSV